MALAERSPQEKLEHIVNGWKGEAFQAVLYNVEDDPVRRKMYTRPPQCTNDAVWNKALRDNPDPERLVPAIGVGFEDMRARVDAQNNQAAQHSARIAEIGKQIQEKTSKTSLTTSTRMSRAAQKQVQLSSRLVRLVSRLHGLSSIKGQPLRRGEEDLKIALEKSWSDMMGRAPGSGGDRGGGREGRMAGMVNELWVAASQRKAVLESMGGRSEEWAVVREEEMQRIIQVLGQQQRTLDHLTKTVNGVADDVGVVREGFGLK